MNRSSSLRALVAVAAAAVVPLALMVPVVQGAGGGSTPTSLGYSPTRAGGQPVPTVPATVSEAVDEWAEYQGQTTCTPAAKPGALKLAAVLRATYGPADIGISRSCGDGGQSEHKEGRALDWMLSYKKPAERAKVEAFLWWLMKPDAAGNAGANARRLGVMYIGWHDRIWRSYAPQNGWTELKGCYSTPSSSYDTYCHRDHAHFTLSWDAAAGRTSFWDNTAELREACDEPSVGAVAQKTGPGTAVTPVKSWLVLATGRGVGTGNGSCRLASDRWSGDGRAVRVKVTGRGGVPATGVAAVRLDLSAVRSNAPTGIVASATGTKSTTTFRVGSKTLSNTVVASLGKVVTRTIVAPVASNGTITIVTRAGATDVRAYVTGWFKPKAAAPKPTPTPTPTPTPSPTPTPAPTPSTSTSFVVVPYPGTPIVPGSKGAAVTSVQKALLARGFAIPALTAGTAAFGSYGSQTLTAVKAYQTKNPALGKADGIIGPKTYAALTAIAKG